MTKSVAECSFCLQVFRKADVMYFLIAVDTKSNGGCINLLIICLTDHIIFLRASFVFGCIILDTFNPKPRDTFVVMIQPSEYSFSCAFTREILTNFYWLVLMMFFIGSEGKGCLRL